MTLRDRIPVEPLAPERLDRLEQRIVRAAPPALARPARAPLWPWALAATSAAAAALAVVALRRPAPPPAAPIVVMTEARGTRLDLGDAVVEVGLATHVVISRLAGGVLVELDAGTVALDVAPRADRPPLWVKAGDVGVRVVGTAFSVRRESTSAEVEVIVVHGTVEVHRAGEVRRVGGGERWSSTAGAAMAATLPPHASGTSGGPDGVGGSARDPRAPLPPDDRGGTAGLPARSPVEVALLDERRAPVRPPSTTGPGTATGTGSARRPHGPGNGSGTTAGPAPADPLGDLRARILGAPLAPGLTTASRTPAEAAAEYQRRFLTGRGAEASAALHALARTQHLQLGKEAEAVRSLDAYLRRFPQGPELEAVLWLRLRILCRRSFGEPCRVAAHAYVARYPGTDRGGLARRVTDTP